MNLAAIAEILGFITKYGVPAFKELLSILKKPEPTEADWEKLFALTEKDFDDRTPLKPS